VFDKAVPFHRLYLTHVNQIITEWKEEETKGIKTARNEDIKTMLFTDDQVAVTDPEDVLQISVHNLESVTSKYGLKISVSKMKTMTLKGIAPARSKIVINNNIIEQINTFNYQGCSILYQHEKDITVKITKFLQRMGIITKNLRSSQAQEQTRLKMYNTFALPTLLHRCETWAIRDNISRNEIYENSKIHMAR
jgi:hypothetical protein